MRKITVDIGSFGRVLSQSESIVGYGGEHNAVSVCFQLDGEALLQFGDAEYYRVIAEGQYSDKIYPQDNAVNYALPQSVMVPPSIHCQLVGYAESNGELSLVAKSEVAELKIGFSEVPYEKMNKEPDILEKAVAECSNYSEQSKQNAEISQNYAEASRLDANLAKVSSAIASESADSASRSAAMAEAVAQYPSDIANALKGSASGFEVVLSDISPREHHIKVFAEGKNLIPYPYSKTVRESGITFTDNGEGSITINGKNDGQGNSVFYLVQNGSVVLPKGNIVTSGLPNGCSIMGITTKGKYVTFFGSGTLSGDTEFVSFYLQIASGNTTEFKNVVVKPMIEKGSTATAYTPYVNISAISVKRSGKNLLPYPYSKTMNGNGITFTDNGDGSITLNGKNDGSGNSAFYFIYDGNFVLPKGSYKISGDLYGCTIIGFSKDAQYISFADSVTLTEDTEFVNFYLQISSGDTTDFDNVVIRPMIEKGTNATEYEPPVTVTEHTPNAEGTVLVPSVYPTTVIYTDTEGVTITAEYSKDVNKEFNNVAEQIRGLDFEVINNVIDLTATKKGGYYYQDGTLIPDNNYDSSDFIPCKSGDYFRYCNKTTPVNTPVVFYDKDKNYVQGIGYDEIAEPYITVPNNDRIAYMRVPVAVKEGSNFRYMYDTNLLVTRQIPYGQPMLYAGDFVTAEGHSLKVVADKMLKAENQWKGKTWYAYGTSLTSTAQGKYVPYVAEFGGMKVVNKGIPGGGIVKNTLVKNAVMNTTDGKSEADLITLEICANDLGATLGTIYDTGNDTFCGALNQCIRYLQQNTTAQIVVISSTPQRYGTTSRDARPPEYKYGSDEHTFYDLTKAMEEVCKVNGVYYIPMGEGSGLGVYRMSNDYLADNIHHTEMGGYNLAHFVWSKLKDIPLWYTEIV